MTDHEWADLAACLRHWWPGDFAESAAEAYRLALDRFAAADVARALGDHLGGGGRFRPSAAELATAIGGSGPRPDAAQAWRLIEEAIGRVRCSVYSPQFDAEESAAIAWLAERDVVLGAFAARRGLCGGPGTLGHEPVADPEVGGAVRGRLAKEWAEAVDVAAERVARGLPSVRPEDLVPRRRSVSGGGMGELVESLRPARELGPGAA